MGHTWFFGKVWTTDSDHKSKYLFKGLKLYDTHLSTGAHASDHVGELPALPTHHSRWGFCCPFPRIPPAHPVGPSNFAISAPFYPAPQFSFYPRDAMRISASLLSPGVRLSVTFVHSIQTAEDIVKLLVRPGSSSFWPMRRYPIPRGTPSAGARNTRGGKICDFQRKLPSISERVRDGPIVCYGTLIGSHMRSIAWWHFQWPWRTPNPVFNLKVT